MATKLQPAPRHDEIVRLRGLVESQHRQLRLLRDEATNPVADMVTAAFPSTCAKPRLTSTAVTRLVEQTAARLALRETPLGAALQAPWPQRRAAIPVLRPSPGLAAYALRNVPDLPNVVFALFLRPLGDVRTTVDRVLGEQQTGEPFLPVFLTHHSDFAPLRDQRLAFEYFPFTLDDTAPSPEPRWRAYFQTTLELTMCRWGVRQVVLL